MRKFRYVSPTGETVELDGDFAWTMTGAPIRGHSWDYELGYRDVSYISNPAREITLDCYVPRENADAMRTVFDLDVMAHQGDPEHWGVFWAGSSWSRGLVVAFEPTDIFPTFISASLKVVLVDPMWRDTGNTHDYHAYVEPPAIEYGLDYPHDFPYDFGYEPGQGQKSIVNESISDSDFLLTVFGAAVNPEIEIGGNVYRVNATVPQGGRLEVDSVNKTVTLYSGATATDAFPLAERGDGKGAGRYIFEPIRRGTSRVSWNRAFGFRITVYESLTEPRWA